MAAVNRHEKVRQSIVGLHNSPSIPATHLTSLAIVTGLASTRVPAENNGSTVSPSVKRLVINTMGTFFRPGHGLQPPGHVTAV